MLIGPNYDPGALRLDGSKAMTGGLVIPDGGYIGSVSDTDAIQIEADGDVVLTQKLGLGVSPAQKFEIGSNDNSDRISIYHDNTDAYITSLDDGDIRFESETGNYLFNYTAGKSNGFCKFYNGDRSKLLYFGFLGSPQVFSEGAALALNWNAAQDVTIFNGATSGETKKIWISGFRSGDAKRTLSIGVGVDAADTVSFDGLSNYYFDGNIGIGETAPETLLEMTGAQPYLTLHNDTHEDSDGGRESRLIFKGEQSGGEEATLAQIQGSHDGVADDTKGDLIFSTHTGSALTEALRIDSNQRLQFKPKSGLNPLFMEVRNLANTDWLVIVCEDATGGIKLNTGDDDVAISIAGNQEVTIPERLTVDNDILMSGTFYATGNIIINSSTDEMLILRSTSTTGEPTIGFYQTTTRRAYIDFDDWNNRLRLNSIYGRIALYTNNVQAIKIATNQDVTFYSQIFGRENIKLLERASAVSDTATYGQLWVKTATPNILMFTDDAGNDFTVDVTAA